MTSLLQRMAGALPATMLVFVAAAFLLPSVPAYSLVFYVTVIPCVACWYGVHGRRIALSPAAVAAVALIAWSGLTLLWGHDDGHRSLRFAGDALATSCFLLALLALLPSPEFRARLGSVLIAFAAANGAFALVVSLIVHQNGERLHGWGVTSNPILGASVMTGAYAAALLRAVRRPERRRTTLAAAAVIGGFILMTESRGPILAFCAVTALILAFSPWWKRVLAALVLMAVVWLLLPASFHRHGLRVVAGRGSSHHFEIWQHTLSLIADRPLFGHGLASNVDLPGITFPHDLYLSLLFYSGVVGFLLFATLGALCARQLARAWREGEGLWMAALGLNLLISGLTDLGQITKGPGPMWFIVWLPVALLAYRPEEEAQPALSSRVPSDSSQETAASL